jgi:glycosyltransferase involved in cell wall biosynthesis
MSEKVLIYCPTFLPEQTGYAHAFAGLVTNLLDDGYEVDVLISETYNGEELFKHPRLNIIRKTFEWRVWMLGLFYQYFCLAQYVFKLHQQNNYKVIFVETGDHPLLIAFMRQQLLGKVVVRFHSTSDTEYLVFGKHFKYKLKRWFWHFMASQRIQNICATSQYHVDYAQSHIIQKNEFTYQGVITNTIETEAKVVVSSTASKTVFMLGRMDDEGFKQKGFETLIKALPHLVNVFQLTQSKLVIVGNGTKFNYLQHAVAAYPFITLYKSMPNTEVQQWLNKADVVLLPSWYEGVSMFALEALATANAVVFGKTGGLIDMVDGNGYLVEPNNVEELSNAIEQLVLTPDLLEYKKRSVQLANQYFSAKQQMHQFKNMLRQLSC